MKKQQKKLTLSMQTLVLLSERSLAVVGGGATLNLSQCGHCPPSRPVSVCNC
jgi:hypothetical protein